MRDATENEARAIVWFFGLFLALLFLGLIKIFKGNFLGITNKNFGKFMITFWMILFVLIVLTGIVRLIIELKK